MMRLSDAARARLKHLGSRGEEWTRTVKLGLADEGQASLAVADRLRATHREASLT